MAQKIWGRCRYVSGFKILRVSYKKILLADWGTGIISSLIVGEQSCGMKQHGKEGKRADCSCEDLLCHHILRL